MKIYFEDGRLERNSGIDSKNGYWAVNAEEGFSYCYGRLMKYRNDERADGMQLPVYTNFSAALNNCFAWNEELRLPEIYLRRDDVWVRIDNLTTRELRAGHNLEKMWIAGAFE